MATDHELHMFNVLGAMLATKNAKVISEEKYHEIVRQLRHEAAAPTATATSTDDPKVGTRWIKRKGFQLVSFPELDLVDVLVIPKKGEFSQLHY